jgi:hypothetical protein
MNLKQPFASMGLNLPRLVTASLIALIVVGCAAPMEKTAEKSPAKSAVNLELRNQKNEQKSLVFPPAIAHDRPIGPVDSALKIRVEQKWNALVAGDLETAYKLMSANSRRIYTLGEFRQDTKVGRWKRASVLDAKCEQKDFCVVSVSVVVGFRIKNAGEVETDVLRAEDWVFSDGDWYFVRKIES